MPSSAGAPPEIATLLDQLRRELDPDVAEELRRLDERLDAGTLRVLLAGEAKRGKSTLTNALIGRELLPSGVVPVTSFQTAVLSGSPERLEVDLPDGDTQLLTLDQLPRFVTQRANPGNRLGVRDVRAVLGDGLPHPRMTLIDSPGFGSTVEHNSQQASAALEQMDIAVLVLTADAPMSASEAALLQRLAGLSVDVVVVLNKIDLIEQPDQDEARAFVAEAAGSALGRPVEMVWCSGRDGLAARLRGDDAAWRASGVAGLLDILQSRASSGLQETLERSLAATAARLAARQLDRCAVRLGAVQSLREDRREELDAFRASLRETERLGQEAVAVLDSAVVRMRKELTEAAYAEVPQLRHRLQRELEEALDTRPSVPPGELEFLARARIEDRLRSDVEQWRAGRRQHLASALDQQRDRAGELLTQAVSGLQASAKQRLGVELSTGAPGFEPPGLGELSYDASAEPGWDEAAVSLLRHSGPRARRRTEQFLRDECDRLADLHVGRARADLQQRLDDRVRQMRSALERAFRETTSDLAAAQESAHSVVKRTDAEVEEAISSLTSRRDALAAILHQLRARATPAPPQIEGVMETTHD